MSQGPAWRRQTLRVLALLALCTVSLQVYFVGRIALMAVVDPGSTTFQRSEIWRLLTEKHQVAWGQEWVDAEQVSPNLRRAVIASEDAGFVEHFGVEWDAVEQAWNRNQRAESRATPKRPPKVVGGSTISQQLAKNLFLSGERTLPRKAQELVLTLALETLLSKHRILEIYLNHVEWGEGLFGAQAASRYYFRRDASRLDPYQAARLAVMLPAPKRFERQMGSAHLAARAATVQARMASVATP
ncbi:monofunctional biosynthetic peptidoglycan transglycosylase [Ideonella sp. A 288]|uniref:monofunctional biosynthetic peptidoglycan transglycosylase n=1 Tax=Ideonella sp. A 288 TaxID=1962181 RepID=UPI000B4B428B|nr:monofunctional biosynthetic peptidoglycan transglycosylase [Ideonella sp. A 288]